MNIVKNICAAALTVGLSAVSASAAPLLFEWSQAQTTGGTETSGYLLIEDTGNLNEYKFTIENTSTDGSSVLGSFQLGWDPDSVSVVSDTSTIFTEVAVGNGFPGTDYNTCWDNRPNNPCNAINPNGPLQPGEMDMFTVLFSGAVTFEEAGGRFQRVEEFGSLKLNDSNPQCPPGTPGCLPPGELVVPLPAGLPLVLTGLGFFGYMRARKRKSA